MEILIGDWLQRKEIISSCGKVIYKCYFHGGLIKLKRSNARFNLTAGGSSVAAFPSFVRC